MIISDYYYYVCGDYYGPCDYSFLHIAHIHDKQVFLSLQAAYIAAANPHEGINYISAITKLRSSAQISWHQSAQGHIWLECH